MTTPHKPRQWRQLAKNATGVTRKNATILVVDDDLSIRDSVGALLGAEGYRVIAAGSGGQGIALATQHRPDLILLDFYLGDMDGMDCITALKADSFTRGIPVVAFTASLSARVLVSAGCVGYIPKPYDPDEFLKLIQGFLSATVFRVARLPKRGA